jgi:hypothetical protein
MNYSNSTSDQQVSGVMTVAEFCRWARLGRTKAYDLFKAGDIKPRKVGARTVILRSDAEAWLQALPAA